VPHLAHWSEITITDDMVEGWVRTHGGNVGLRTRRFPAVDLDVDDPEIAEACEMAVMSRIGRTARRTRANAARRLLLYRLEGPPFTKRIVTFMTPSGTMARAEILATGQQAAVAGAHSTGAALEWTGGAPLATELAPMTGTLAEEVVGALHARLQQLGCAIESTRPRQPASPPSCPSRTWAEDRELAELALQKLDPDLPYQDWIAVGMALHAKEPVDNGPGFRAWDAWSSSGITYPGTQTLERHWASFHSGKGIGFGTLIALARRARWGTR
jgi:hypothetical protein